MNVEYILRELRLNELTDSMLSNDVQWLVNYFKDITSRKETKLGIETWYDKNDQWVIQVNDEKWNYTRIFRENWHFLRLKYQLNQQETSDLYKGMLEFTLKRRVYTPDTSYWDASTMLEFTLKRRVYTPGMKLLSLHHSWSSP